MRKYVILLCLVSLIEIALALYLTVWREHFWNAVSNKQTITFLHEILIFLSAALGVCFISGISSYLVQLSTIEWRKKLNKLALSVIHSDSIENLNQRIQADCAKYPEIFITLSFGVIKAVLYVVVFSISLISVFGFWYLSVLILYTFFGSIATSYIAKPLIHLNYEQQRAEASYRNDLSIYNFKECLFFMLGIAKRTKYLNYFQQFYMQIAVIIPLILIAPEYFTTAMTVGALMRFNSLSSTILDNLGYGISSWGQINILLSCRRRLKEINII